MIERHALKFALLGVVEQQRIMRKLAKNSRSWAKETLKNAESAQANLYDWHRRVRLSREARAINLFRAFLKGTPYNKVENSLNIHSLDPLVVVKRYLPCTKEFATSKAYDNFEKQFDSWIDAAF